MGNFEWVFRWSSWVAWCSFVLWMSLVKSLVFKGVMALDGAAEVSGDIFRQ